MRTAVLLAIAAACGDNLEVGEPLATGATLAIVAHQDDDLLFMQRDLLDAIRAHTPVTIVYVTAGDDQRDLDYVQRRYAGLRAAYSAAAASADPWRCGSIAIAGHAAEHCRLDAAQISLVFLGYPDGGIHGEFAGSLLSLWEGRIGDATTIANVTATYDRDGLVATLAAVIATAQPRVIHTLEVASTHGDDHSDHMIVGALAVLARARAGLDMPLVAHRGYDVGGEAIDALAPVAAIGTDAFARYSACAERCAPCGEACATFSATYESWLERGYAVGVGRYATGALAEAIDGACLHANDDGTVAMGACDTVWHVDGVARTGDRCLHADTALTLGACATATPVALDDEGHLWLATPPAPQLGMDLAHLDCVTGDARAALCGAPAIASWTVVPAIVATPRSALAMTASGRAVRLGDITGDGRADLCAIDTGELACAPGDGVGGFAAVVRIAPLAIAPDSLALGDIDGDGRLDACGRDAGGISCATSASGFAIERFAPAFAGATAETDRSLAIVDGNVCAITPSGIACAARGGQAVVRSAWPSLDEPVWIADVDADRDADWCALTTAGPACGRGADRALSTDGTSWGFSFHGAVEGAAASFDASTGALADVDGDGRADLCALVDATVACASSQAVAFGPRFALATFPSLPTALWLGDLDGDGTADACVDLGASIACALAH